MMVISVKGCCAKDESDYRRAIESMTVVADVLSSLEKSLDEHSCTTLWREWDFQIS